MRVDPGYLANLTQSLNVSTGNEQKLTQQLSSGLRLTKLSDDPTAAAENVLLSQSISGQDTYVQSASREQSLLQVTDTTLGEVVSSVTSAISLGVSAGDGSLSSSNLAAISAQVLSLRDTVLGLANTSYLGAHLFSGSKGDTPPFVQDLTTNPATTTYQGDSHTQSLVTPEGQSIQVNLPGPAIFSAAGANLLDTLNQMVSNFASGNLAGVTANTAQLSAALNNVTTQRSVLGSSLSRIDASSSYARTQETEFQAQQSTLLSADPASIATNLQADEVQHQALLSVIAGLSKSQQLFSLLQ